MSANLRYRPLTDRTGFHPGSYKPSPFSRDTTWSQTRALLEREIEMLQHGDTRTAYADYVIELDVRPDQITKDGRLHGGRTSVGSPAVRVTFDTSKHGRLAYPCDTFPTWQANVRAVALALEALRKVERYGVAAGQYVGAAQLPAGSGGAASHMTREDAEGVLLGLVPDPGTPGPALLRRAKALSHPDRHSGDRTLWDQVEQAAAVLGLS